MSIITRIGVRFKNPFPTGLQLIGEPLDTGPPRDRARQSMLNSDVRLMGAPPQEAKTDTSLGFWQG